MTRRPAWALLDVVAVLALVALAVVGLAPTFRGWGFLVLAEIAALIGVLLAVAAARVPVPVVVAVSPVVALLLAGPVALRSAGLGGGIPDAETVADALTGSWTGWGEMLTTLPFVDLSGPPAMVPYLLGFTAGLVATLWALRSRSAAGPALPLLGVLVVVLLLREPGEGLLEWFPVGFAVVAVAWVAFRGLQFTPERSQDIRGSAHGRIGRGVLAVLVVAAALLVAIPLTGGSAASRGESLHGRVGELPEVSELASPLRNFRTYTKQAPGTSGNVYNRHLFTVFGAPRGSRVRLVALDTYDGRAWEPDNHTMTDTTDDRFQRIDTIVKNDTRGRAIGARVEVKRAYRSAWVPTLGSLTTFDLSFADPKERRDEFRYNLATSTAVTPLGLKPSRSYEFTAILADDRLRPSMAAWPEPLPRVSDTARADSRFRDVIASRASPMRKVFVLADYLRRNGRYSDGFGPGETQYRAGHDRRRLFKDFLLAARPVGDDEQYAAAMALLANRVGVPARVVVGAVVPRGGRVHGSDIQAWVELRVDDGSWRTLPTSAFMSTKPPGPRGGVAPVPVIPPKTAPRPSGESSRDLESSSEEQQKARDQSQAPRRSVLVRLLPWLVPIVLALVVPLTKLVRRRLRRTRGRPSDRMAGAWTELVDHARDLGIPVRRHATRPAQARVLAMAGELSRRGDDGVFGLDEPREADVEAYWDQVMGERRVLQRQQPVLRRVWAPFNPVTLLRRHGGD